MLDMITDIIVVLIPGAVVKHLIMNTDMIANLYLQL